MMKINRMMSFAMVIVGSCIVAAGQEKKLERSALPPAVEKTVQAETKGATIKGFLTERENGRKVYEAETVLDGHTRDLQIATDGTLNEIEEEVAFDSLPGAVQAGLTAKAVGAKIVKVESLTKRGKLVAYEATTLRGTKKGEVQVGPDGGRLAHVQ